MGAVATVMLLLIERTIDKTKTRTKQNKATQNKNKSKNEQEKQTNKNAEGRNDYTKQSHEDEGLLYSEICYWTRSELLNCNVTVHH